MSLTSLILSGITLFILTRKKSEILADVRESNVDPVPPPVESVPDMVNDYINSDVDDTELYLSRLEQERIFDARIQRLKAEVSVRQPITSHTPTVAEVLHPNVYNLPHEAISDDVYPDVEVSE